MNPRIVAIVLFGIALTTAASFAQTYPQPYPDQPVQPRTPTLERRAAPPPAVQRPAPPQPPPPPFQLVPQAQAQVDRALNQWEEHNRKIKTFDCRFKRWIYDAVFSVPQPDGQLQAKYVDMGVIKFKTPDQGLFRVETTEKDDKVQKIEDNRAEHWMCDGKAVYEYDPVSKQVREHKLPPELQGKAIANSPLPFMFGSEAKNLKQRYYIRIITPPNSPNQTWFEAYPRGQQDAANFHHAQFIIDAQKMTPFALRIVEPNGKDYRVYQFYDIVVNDPLKFFQGDPFRPYTPVGWKLIPDNQPSAQAQRPPADGRR